MSTAVKAPNGAKRRLRAIPSAIAVREQTPIATNLAPNGAKLRRRAVRSAIVARERAFIATHHFISSHSLFLASTILTLALLFVAAPVQAAPSLAEADYPRPEWGQSPPKSNPVGDDRPGTNIYRHQPYKLSARQRALIYDHRTAPKNISLIGRFNAADHRPDSRDAGPQPAPAPTLFLDLEREVEVEVDAWYGKAGVQINW